MIEEKVGGPIKNINYSKDWFKKLKKIYLEKSIEWKNSYCKRDRSIQFNIETQNNKKEQSIIKIYLGLKKILKKY